MITELVNISFLRAIEIYRRNCRHFSSADGFVSPLFVVVVVVVAARVIFLITIFSFSKSNCFGAFGIYSFACLVGIPPFFFFPSP